VPGENFWTLWCEGRLTEADTQTIWLGSTPSGLTSAHLHHPAMFFMGRMPFLPPNQQCKALKATSAFDKGEDARVLLSGVTCTISIPSTYFQPLKISEEVNKKTKH